MCVPRFASGRVRTDCLKIPWPRFARAGISNVSRKNAASAPARPYPVMRRAAVRETSPENMLENSERSTYLAFDLGAESGRAILGRFESGRLSIEEIRRFRNEPIIQKDGLHWNVGRLWEEMK